VAEKLHRVVVKVHRVCAGLFLLATIPAGYASFQGGSPPSPLVYAPLPFLFVLMLTGTYQLARPWVLKRRAGRAAGA
jgi:hypothetical protein